MIPPLQLVCKYCVRGRKQPYVREKVPLPKRQYRQGDTIPLSRHGALTPIQPFHDVLSSQNGNLSQSRATGHSTLNQSAALQSEMSAARSGTSVHSSTLTNEVKDSTLMAVNVTCTFRIPHNALLPAALSAHVRH